MWYTLGISLCCGYPKTAVFSRSGAQFYLLAYSDGWYLGISLIFTKLLIF